MPARVSRPLTSAHARPTVASKIRWIGDRRTVSDQSEAGWRVAMRAGAATSLVSHKLVIRLWDSLIT